MVDINSDQATGGDQKQKVNVGPWGIHVKDGDTEVNISLRGVQVRDEMVRVNLSVWRPLLGCAVTLAVLAAIVTVVVVGIVKVMM